MIILIWKMKEKDRSNLMMAARASLAEELLVLPLTLDRLLKDEPAPVDREYPANDVDAREHLNDADSQL